MLRLSIPILLALAACTPSPQKAAMPKPSQVPATTAQAPILEPVSAAWNPVPASPADSPAAAEGRKTLSTAFVRVGPDGHLTVALHDGRVLILRDVVMGAKDYCGVPIAGDADGARYCGGYADVAAARPGGAAAPEQPNAAHGPAK